jgi:4-oxalocrotonate tautomerase
MPFVRIDLSDQHPAGFAQKVGDIIFDVMKKTINVPEDDKFQVITKHNVKEMVHPKSYLGVTYTDNIIFIQITLNEGRTTDMKKKFYKAINDQLVLQLKVRAEDIIISLTEVNKENWSFGNGKMTYEPKP